MPQEQLLNSITEYFRLNVFEPHLNALENECADLNSYAANPLLTPYLSRIIQNEHDAAGVAKVLFFSRTLSTSINTSFGTHIRKVLVNNNLAQNINSRSNIISFTDQTTNSQTVCLLKSGPKTINSGDVSGIRNKLNNLTAFESSAIGVIYGLDEDLNPSYLDLRNTHSVFVGRVFWHKITGNEGFYNQLIQRMSDLSAELGIEAQFETGLNTLINQVHDRFFN